MGTNRQGIPHPVFNKRTTICPYCGGTFKSLGIANHRAACSKKHNKIKRYESTRIYNRPNPQL